MDRIGGVFVGVGSQDDKRIEALKYAPRDAEWLWAIFADAAEAAGGQTDDLILLTNNDATTPRLFASLETAVQSSSNNPFDLFLIHLSCHGDHSGRVLLHDADKDADDLAAIALGKINELLADLRTGSLIMTLDICFAGTVLGFDGSGNREALLACLQGLEGDDRAVAWAAGPNEPAHESDRLRHGYLTMGLLRSLRRAREAGDDRLLTASWLHEAMETASDEARRLGQPQTPGSIIRQGIESYVPVPAVGARQRRIGMAEGVTPVAPDLGGLEKYGISEAAINAVRAKIDGSAGLNNLQLRAIAPAGLLAGQDIVVSAPTSAGKTLIAELAILRMYERHLKSVVLVPTRALAREHSSSFKRDYGHLGMQVIRSTGDAGDDDDLFLKGHFDVAVVTYEKFSGLIYRDVRLIDQVGLVVLDELQLIGDPQRGRVPELLIALLHRRRALGLNVQLVGLCGHFADLRGLEEWLAAESVGEGERPVPLQEAVVDPSGRMVTTLRDGSPTHESRLDALQVDLTGAGYRLYLHAERTAFAVTALLVAQGKQVLVFRTSRPKVRKAAVGLVHELGLGSDGDLLAAFDEACRFHEETRLSRVLRSCILGRVGFHSAELAEHERMFVENQFRHRRLNVVVATTTLAEGVNLPANAVVIADHEFWRGRDQAPDRLPPHQYRNMAGRAGRAGQGMESGESYLVAESPVQRREFMTRYLDEDGSILNAGLGGLAVADRALAAAAIVRQGGLMDLVNVLQETFWGYQNRQSTEWREQLRNDTEEALEQLLELGLLRNAKGSDYEITALGSTVALYGVCVETAQRVSVCVGAMVAAEEDIGREELIALSQLALEVEKYIPVQETAETWRNRLRGWAETRPVLVDELDKRWGDDDDERRCRFKRCALLRCWLGGLPASDVETAYSEDREVPGLGSVREIAQRTSDILPAIAGLVASRLPDQREALELITSDLRTSLEFGISEAATGLQRLRIGLTRKQCLDLASAGISNGPELSRAITQDRATVEALFTEIEVARIEEALGNRSLKRRREITTEDPILELFPDGPLS